MDTKKRERIQSTLQKELGYLIERHLDIEPSILITITGIEYSPDNRRAEVNVSVFPDDAKQEVISLLNNSAKSFIPLLQKRIRMGYIPDLVFKYDSGIVKNARIQELIEKNRKSR